MPLNLIHPQLPDDKKKELRDYIWTKWTRTKSSHQTLHDRDYPKWTRAYEGVPLEEIRSVPFYKASNMVVKVIRIYLDTFTARSLNVMFATKPLYVVENLKSEWKEGFEYYINAKAGYDWGHYQLARDMMFRGNKNGTCIYKTIYDEQSTIDVNAIAGRTDAWTEEDYTYYRGPCARPVPFEDFYLYPITVNNICDAEIKFHRVRYVEEEAKRLFDKGLWQLPAGIDIDTYLRIPRDVKRDVQQGDSGVVDTTTKELHTIECHLRYAITNDSGKIYDIIVVIEEQDGAIFDVYFNPYPRNLCTFTDYRPYPREDFFYGESLCQILGQSQEECSRIHNERRDNSTIASSVVFKRRSGANIPNPSTNWYPGKVFDLDDMDDLDFINPGRNYEDMIAQEDYVFNLAERLSGIGEAMQSSSTGQMGKRGVYNTTGTISVMAEGNQRQDTNIRDVRNAMSSVALVATRLQATFAPDDPLIETLPKESQAGARAALEYLKSDKSRYVRFEVKTSNAGINSEVRKANLMAIAGVLQQYGGVVQQMLPEILNPQTNPQLKQMMVEIVNMQRNMAKRVLKAFDEWDAIEDLPDVPGSAKGSTQAPPPLGAGAPNPAGANGAPPAISRAQLASLAALPPAPGAPANQ